MTTIKLNRFYKNNGKTQMMPDYLIPVSPFEEIEEEEEYMKIYKDHEGDALYNAWDVVSGEIVVYAESRFIHYMELME